MDNSSKQAGLVVIGDCRIEQRIGAGGMGIVYLATQMSLNRLVALKVLGDRLKRPGDKARFQREAQAVAKLKHPNIASVYFIGQDDRLWYIAMEYIDGISLREFIDRLARTTKLDASLEELLQSSVGVSEVVERFDEPASTVVGDDSMESEDRSLLTPEAEYSISTTQHIRRCCEIVRDAANALAHAHEQGVIVSFRIMFFPEEQFLFRKGPGPDGSGLRDEFSQPQPVKGSAGPVVGGGCGWVGFHSEAVAAEFVDVQFCRDLSSKQFGEEQGAAIRIGCGVIGGLSDECRRKTGIEVHVRADLCCLRVHDPIRINQQQSIWLEQRRIGVRWKRRLTCGCDERRLAAC